MIPPRPSAAKVAIKLMSMAIPAELSWVQEATAPAVDCTAIRARLVPAALSKARPPKITSAGTIRNPPPTPTIPVRIPTAAAANPRCTGRMGNGSDPCSCFPLSIATAAPITTTIKMDSLSSGESQAPKPAPSTAPRIPVGAAMSAVESEKLPDRIAPTAPVPAIRATIQSDSVTAISSGRPRPWTRIGTVRMEPPEPSRPSATPTTMAPRMVIMPGNSWCGSTAARRSRRKERNCHWLLHGRAPAPLQQHLPSREG